MKAPFVLWMNILNFKKVKFIYICSKLVFECLAHQTDIHLSFVFIKLLNCILARVVYVM